MSYGPHSLSLISRSLSRHTPCFLIIPPYHLSLRLYHQTFRLNHPRLHKMSFLPSLNPIPSLPKYPGPYTVGTIDVEFPLSLLPPVTPHTPPDTSHIKTLLFRIFYPAIPDPHPQRATWLSHPQRQHIAAYGGFLGLNKALSEVLSWVPRHLHWTVLPAHKNATMVQPPPDGKWPTAIFSHGLGGTRNTYSHIAGSLASHGVVVFCIEHREQSAALTTIRDPDEKTGSKVVEYKRLPHELNKEVWGVRDAQLRVRLWEVALLYEVLVKLGRGEGDVVEGNLNSSTPRDVFAQFLGKLNVLDPGRVIFAGHSFGGSTVVQLLKSVFYADHSILKDKVITERLFIPSSTASIRQQITPHTPTILLDMWCLPLVSPTTRCLYHLPLPAYTPSGPGGSTILAIESDAFVVWRPHLHTKAQLFSPSPSLSHKTPITLESFGDFPQPYWFYPVGSAHIAQSDFAPLFPTLIRHGFKCEADVGRVLRLNVRAMVQFLRGRGYRVTGTARGECVEGLGNVASEGDWIDDDAVILERGDGKVEGWKAIEVVGLGGERGLIREEARI